MNIHEIAERSGVSVATVSRVINENPNVSAKTREHILRIMNEANYTPNAFARGLGLNTMRMVGILCTDVARPFYAQAVSLLERSLRSKGFDSLLYSSGYLIEDKKKCLKLLLNKKVDAVILVGSAFNERRDNSHISEAAKQIPVFLINGMLDFPNVYSVLCNEEEAMFSNVHEMSAAGIKDILYLHDMVSWAWAGTQKLNGFLRGLQHCGIKENPELICAVEHGILSAQEKTAQLIESGVNFSGVLASEDLLAIGAQKALNAAGETRPIIGFNNSIFVHCAEPSLTSVDNMLDTLCSTAADMLARFLNGEHLPPKIVVSATLVERETFRRAR